MTCGLTGLVLALAGVATIGAAPAPTRCRSACSSCRDGLRAQFSTRLSRPPYSEAAPAQIPDRPGRMPLRKSADCGDRHGMRIE